MEKINEFVNNNNLDEILIDLNRKLFLDKADLSDSGEIIKSDYYKEIISYGVDIIPSIIKELQKEEVWYILCFAVFDILDEKWFYIPIEDRGKTQKVKAHVVNWWNENKSKYGKS